MQIELTPLNLVLIGIIILIIIALIDSVAKSKKL